MILICDKEVSERALILRQKLFLLGYPCACSAVSQMGKYFPFKIIVTFENVFYIVRQMPYDDIFVISIGKGFVNSVLNAERAVNNDELIRILRDKFLKEAHIGLENRFNFGVISASGLFVSNYFIEMYGKAVVLTKTESMIFKYLYSFSGKDICIPAKLIYRYCSSVYKLSDKNISNNIAVNVKKINDKFSKAASGHIIKAKRGKGYYSVI